MSSQPGYQRRQHWALLPFVAGVLLGLAVSTIILIRPDTTVTNISIGRERQDQNEKFNRFLEELHKQERDTQRLSEEMTMKRTVYYAVMLTDTTSIESLNIIKNTWARDMGPAEIGFFLSSEYPQNTDTIKISSSSSEQLEIETLKYICNNKLNETKWFFLSYDNVYVKREQLENYLLSLETMPGDFGYLGKPIKRESSIGGVCMAGPGSVFSQSILSQLCPRLNKCNPSEGIPEPDCVLGECVRKQLPSIQCARDVKLHEIFLNFVERMKGNILDPRHKTAFDKALTIFPVDPKLMYNIHEAVLSKRLNYSQQTVQDLKRSVDYMIDLLPLTEIRLYNERVKSDVTLVEDDITSWKLISSNLLMSCVENSPAIKIHSLWKEELELLSRKSIDYVNSREDEEYTFKRIVNAYWRLDAQLGTEYVIDFETKLAGMESDYSSPTNRFRASLLRQYNDPEVNPVIQQVDTAQHTTISVLVSNDLTEQFEHFMSNFEETLKLDQRFDLLAVHMKSVRTEQTNYHQVDKIISLYANKYPQANFKVLKSPHKLSRSHAISLLVHELRPNDLVFLSDLELQFDYQFLNRCRSYPLQKQQVYFPIPFNQIDPAMLSATNHTQLHDGITPHSGHWLVNSYSVACLYAIDILSTIEHEEAIPVDEINVKELYSKLVKNGYSIIRSADKGLRKMYSKHRNCELDYYGEHYEPCQSLPDSYEKLYLKTQLSVLLLDHEGEHTHKKY